MDDVAQLITAYASRVGWSADFKLEVLMDLEQLRDARILPFLLDIVTDRKESTRVRLHVVKQLRSGWVPAARPRIAHAVLRLLAETAPLELRLQAALALADLVDVDGVLLALGGAALDAAEPVDLRYAAFTSLERAGPTGECVGLLRQLLADETLGRSARSLLRTWQLE